METEYVPQSLPEFSPQELSSHLDSSPKRSKNKQIIERQNAVIAKLHRFSIKELNKHLEIAEEETKRLGGEFDRHKEIRGWIFETFSAIEFQETDSLASQEILSIFQDPRRCRPLTRGLQIHRRPDAVSIKEDETTDDIVVQKISEVKAGRLNQRTLLQLDPNSEKGTVHGLVAIIDAINLNKDHLEEFGLPGLAAKKGKVVLADDFYQELIVVRDNDIKYDKLTGAPTEESVERLMRSYDSFNGNDYLKLKKLLMDPNKVKIRRSVFSRDDITAIAEYFEKHLK